MIINSYIARLIGFFLKTVTHEPVAVETANRGD